MASFRVRRQIVATGGADITGNVTINNNLTVTGSVTQTGSVGYAGGLSVTGGSLLVSACMSRSACAAISGCTNVTACVNIASPLTVAGSTKLTGGLQVGTNGIKASSIMFGTAVCIAPSFAATAGASEAGSPITVANAAIGMKCWAIASSVPAGLILVAASPNTGTIDLKFNSAACTAVAGCNLTIQYLLFN